MASYSRRHRRGYRRRGSVRSDRKRRGIHNYAAGRLHHLVCLARVRRRSKFDGNLLRQFTGHQDRGFWEVIPELIGGLDTHEKYSILTIDFITHFTRGLPG